MASGRGSNLPNLSCGTDVHDLRRSSGNCGSSGDVPEPGHAPEMARTLVPKMGFLFVMVAVFCIIFVVCAAGGTGEPVAPRIFLDILSGTVDLVFKSGPTCLACVLGVQLFRNAAEQAPRSDGELIAEMRKLNAKVDGMDAKVERLQEVQTSMKAQVEQSVRQATQPLYEAIFVPKPLRSPHTRTSSFRRDLITYQGTTSCCVLSQLFPKTAASRPYWLNSKQEEVFPGCGAHILQLKGPFSQDQTKLYQIEINDPRNGLVLFEALEEELDSGFLTFLPEEEEVKTLMVPLSVHISQEIEDKEVLYESKHAVELVADEQLDQNGKLKFGHLHHKVIKVKAPFMRSLYLQAKMAYRAESSRPSPMFRRLPNPDHFLSRYKERCDLFEKMERLYASQPCDSPLQQRSPSSESLTS